MRWSSPWARLGLLLVLGIGAGALWLSYGQYERSVRIQVEIDTLRREADRVARENETLAEKIQYFASPDFKEEEAKEKLGLRRQEERVIAIDGDVPLEANVEAAQPTTPTETVTWVIPNYEKWWRRFAHPWVQ